MAFTTSSTVSGVGLRFDELAGAISELVIFVENDDDVYIDFLSGYPKAGTQALSDLQVAQSIYGSDDGFQDSDGNDITPTINGYLHGTDIDLLEEHALYNPLKSGSYEAWIAEQKMRGDLVKHGERVIDSETGRPGVQSPIDDVPMKRNIDSDTHTISLADWSVAEPGGDTIWLVTSWLFSEGFTSSTYKQKDLMRGLIAWLNTLHSNTDIPESTWADSNIENIDFSLVQATGQSAMVFQYEDHHIIAEDSDGNVAAVYFVFERQSGANFDRDAFDALMDETTISIDTVSDDQEAPTRGASDVPFAASRIEIGGMQLVPLNDMELELRGLKPDGSRFRSPLGGYAGRIIEYSDLPFHTGSTTEKRIDRHVFQDLLIFDESSDGIVKLEEPKDHIRANGLYRLYPIYNFSENNNLTIELPNGDTFAVVRPGQSCNLVSLLKKGGAGELLVGGLPPHKISLNAGGASLPDLSSLDVVRFTPAASSDTNRYRMFGWGDASEYTLYRDAEAFSLGTTDSDGTNFNWNVYTGWDSLNRIITCNLNGRIEISATFAGDTSGSGSINSWSGLFLFSQSGTNLPVELARGRDGAISGGDPFHYTVIYNGDWDAGDRFFFVMRHRTSTSIDWANVNPDVFEFQAQIDTIIRESYAAAA